MKSEVITLTSEFKQIVTQVCKSAVAVFGADHSAVVSFALDFATGDVVGEYPDIGTQGLRIPIRDIPAEQRLISTKDALYFPCVEDEWDLGAIKAIFKQFGIQSILIVPIVVDDWVIGSFSLDFFEQRESLSNRQIEQCKSYAAQVALALKNVKRVSQLEFIRETTLAITSESLPHEELLRLIIRQAVRLLEARSGGIYEYSPDRQALVLVQHYAADHQAPPLGVTLHKGEGMAGRLIDDGLPFIIVDDYSQWEGRASAFEHKNPFAAVVEVPLTWRSAMIGVLYIEDEVGRRFTRDDALVLKLFADHAAIALNNEKMAMDKIEKQRQLEKIAEYSPEIIGNLPSVSLDDRLNLIARHVTEITHAETCGIFLYDSPQMIRLEASYGHRPGAFEKGRKFLVQTGVGTGLTGHIAALGQPFRAHGDALRHYPAAATGAGHTPSQQCYSLLMIPLNQRIANGKVRIGWIRVDNKKDKDGRASPEAHFTQNDIWILMLFAEMVNTALETVDLIGELNTQKQHLEWLTESWKRLSAFSTEQEIIDHVAQTTLERLSADVVAIWSFDAQNGGFVNGALHADHLPPRAQERFDHLRPLTDGTAAWVLQQNWVGVENLDVVQMAYMKETTRDFLKTLGIVSFQGAALKIGDTVLGVLYADYKQERTFSEEEQTSFKDIAAHASLALSLALSRVRLLERLQRTQHAISEIGRASLTTDLNKILMAVAQNVQIGIRCDAVSCYAYFQDTREVFLPPGIAGRYAPRPAATKAKLKPNSIVYEAIHNLADDVYETHDAQNDPWMSSQFVRTQGFVTSSCYRLRVGERIVGVMFINYRTRHTFADEKEIIKMFVNQAAIAIDNALRDKGRRASGMRAQYHLLQNWLSMLSGGWSHEISKRVTTISADVFQLRKLVDEQDRAGAGKLLDKIDDILREMTEERLAFPLSSESGVESVLLYDLLYERLGQLWFREPYHGVQLQEDFQLPLETTVRISPDWMKWVIDVLVDNAVNAMQNTTVKRLIVSTRRKGDKAHITFSDSGTGIPSEIEHSLFRVSIAKPKGVKGAGINTLIARAIVETYNGSIRIDETGKQGTSVTVILPLE